MASVTNLGRSAVVFAGCLAVAWGGYNFGRALLGPKQGGDFAQHYIVSKALMEGRVDLVYNTGQEYEQFGDRIGVRHIRGIHEGGPYRHHMTNAYPPFMAVAALPLAVFPFGTARLLFFAISLAAMLLAVGLLFLDRPREDRRRMILAGLGVMLMLFPVWYTLYMGQVTAVLLLLLVGAMELGKRDRQWSAGLLVAVAGVIKVFPFIYLLWFVLRRQYRAALWTVIFAAVLTGATLPVVGVESYATYATKVVPQQWSGGAHPRNQGFAGTFLRLLTPSHFSSPLADCPGAAKALSVAASALALLAGSMFAWRGGRGRGRGYEMGFAMFLCIALLVLGKFWDHYAVLLLPCWLLCLEVGSSEGATSPVALAATALSYCVWAFVFCTGEELEAVPRSVWGQPLHATKFAATLVLLACTWVHLRRMETPGPVTVVGRC